MATWLKGIHSFMAFAVICLALLFMSHTQSKNEIPDNCDMVWMYESYATIGDFTSSYSRMGSKYRLLYYREGNGIDIETQPRGIPVLFIPGNAGSYRQARSLASFCSTTSHQSRHLPAFDFFTADFNEDFTAFHGGTLLDQAEYLNDAIRYILGLYSSSETSSPPTSVIVIGHSMGGIVARTLLTLPNYVENSINTIITLSTPHVLPPLSFDRDLLTIYDRVNQFWRYQSAYAISSKSALNNMALISITGGKSDEMVPSDLTSVSSIVHPDHGFSTYTYSIPGVWTGIDHLAIVWCRQLRDKLGETLFAIVDPSSSTRTLPLQQRMRAFENNLLSEFERYIRSYEISEVKSMRGLQDDSNSSFLDKILSVGHNITIRPSLLKNKNDSLHLSMLGSRKYGDQSVHVMDIPSASSTYVGIMTNTTKLETLAILLCEDPSDDILNASPLYDNDHNTVKKSIRCLDAKQHAYARLPASLSTSSYPSDNYGQEDNMKFFFIDSKYDAEFKPTSLIVYDGSHDRSASFLQAASINMDFATADFTSGQLFLENNHITFPSKLYHDISLKSADSSLLSYKLKLQTDDSRCKFQESTSFSPMIRQYIMDPLESRYHVNVEGKDITIHSHGPRAPYIPFLPAFFGDNLHLQVFSPPVECPEGIENNNIRINIRIDIWSSLSNMAMRYRTLLVTFPYAVTLLIFGSQLGSYYVHGTYPAFEYAAQKFCCSRLLSWIFGLVTIYFCLGSVAVRFWINKVTLRNDSEKDMSLYFFNQFMRYNDFLLGTSDERFWFLAPLFFVIAIGLAVLLEAIVIALSSLICPVHRKIARSRHQWAKHIHNTEPVGPFVWSCIMLLVPVLYFIPFQVTCLILTLVHLIYTLPKAHLLSNEMPSNRSHYNFCVSVGLIFLWQSALNAPFLIVWLHNLSWKWTLAFSTVHNIFASISQVILMVIISWTNFVPRQKKTRAVLFTRFVVFSMASYAMLCGFTNGYVMHHFLGFLCLWFLAIYGDNVRAAELSKRSSTLYDNLL